MIQQKQYATRSLLVLPPGDSPCDCPWMGVPALVGYLKQYGFPNTVQRDLDLDLYHYTLTPRAHARMMELYRQELRTMGTKGKLWKRLFLRYFGRIMMTLLRWWELRDVKFFQKFREDTPIHEQFPEKGLIRYRKTLNRVMKLMGVYYYPCLAYPKFFSNRDRSIFYKVHLWLGCQLHDYMNLGPKAMRAFYEDEVLPEIRERGYQIVGASVSVQRQYDPAIILAETIRDAGLDCKVLLGGSYVSEVYDANWLDDEVVEKFDYVVRYEGEDALRKILLNIEGECTFEEIPNLLYIRDGKRVEHERDRIRDIDTLPAPNFDDIPLEKYVDRPVRLPIMGNRGCYWARCTFCAHFWSLGVGKMRDRSAEKLVSDMHELQERHGVRTFFFCDESMYPPTLDGLAELIPETGIDAKWAGMIRFEDNLTREYLQSLRDAGCYALFFGLESMSQRMQDVIKKGTNVPTVWRVLRDCKEVGIKVHLFMIFGIPGETEEDMLETVNFMRDHTDMYETVQIAQFELMVGSPIWLKHDRYGISEPKIVGGHLRKEYSEVHFERVEGLTNDEVARWVDEIEHDEVIYRKNLWSGYGFRIYQPDPPSDERRNSKPPRPPKRYVPPPPDQRRLTSPEQIPEGVDTANRAADMT